jgi:hypothetical protein
MRYTAHGVAIAMALCAMSWLVVWALSGDWAMASLSALIAVLPAILAADYLLQTLGMEDDHVPPRES